jgi:hypothetical protein
VNASPKGRDQGSADTPFPEAVSRFLIEGMAQLLQGPAHLSPMMRFVRDQVAEERHGVRLEAFGLLSRSRCRRDRLAQQAFNGLTRCLERCTDLVLRTTGFRLQFLKPGQQLRSGRLEPHQPDVVDVRELVVNGTALGQREAHRLIGDGVQEIQVDAIVYGLGLDELAFHGAILSFKTLLAELTCDLITTATD